MTEPGLFITFEGGEGAGKTTLMARLFSYLKEQGLGVVRTREPGGCRLAETVRSMLLSPERSQLVGMQAELLLFLAARAQHIEEVIAPALAEGKVVLCDRFNDSTVAYQGHARGLGRERVAALCELVCEDVVPRLTLLLDIEPGQGLGRATRMSSPRDRIESEDVAFHRRVREGFLLLAECYPERIRVLDASRSPREVFADALEPLEELLLERKWMS